MNKSILVPIDFTIVTENALVYAIPLAEKLHASIMLLNFVKTAKEVEPSTKLLKGLQEKYESSGIEITVHAVEGGIKDMGSFAESHNAGLIVMGTHGLKGLQYLVGSKALGVITNSSVPFVVVQNLPEKISFSNIVVPLNFLSEEKVVLGSASKFAKAIGAKMHVFAASFDDEILNGKVQLNLSFAKRFLRDKEIEHTIQEAAGKKPFEDEIMDFTKVVQADIIALVNHHEDGYKNLFGKNFDQNILTNNQNIPVFIFSGKKIADLRDIFMMFS
ncbi:MAG: universal stress protein [Schleiferiaceae bacterium]|nr:universal stress protein [Schleiferiaceae bacterium]